MGSLKDAKLKEPEEKEFSLTNLEFKYIEALNQGGISAYNYYRELTKSYLAIIAGSSWGYPEDAVLDFSIDPETKKVKVSPAKPIDNQ